ncbi:MAG: exodeoxyribonuclease VII large subunit [Haliscomenobacter sp.]|nr:exodeoxyribonuclease VII large subunit [Haliscomenobacter sp.]
MTPTGFRLFEVFEFIRRVLALNLPDALWIRAEIAQVKSSRGHIYLDLIEKEPDTDQWIAQASAVIWSSTFRPLRASRGSALDALLQEGMEILIKARVDFHERYGLKLVIDDIDPAYTVGQLALVRERKFRQLAEEGLIGKNRELPLPPVLQRIAVISAEQAAGFQDFQEQLRQNAYGYQFSCTFFPAAMQGNQVETEIVAQLGRIRNQAGRYDAVAIIRGGGARLDLAGFDSIPLCRAIAAFPLPVFTGIGHDIDETLADLVAHSALKTPTAVAEFLLQHNLQLESQLLEWAGFLRQTAVERLFLQERRLDQTNAALQQLASRLLAGEQDRLHRFELQIPLLSGYFLREENQRIETAEKICTLLSIENTLERGFSITLLNGHPIRGTHEVPPGSVLTTRLKDGEVESVAK